ncbi:hypothetical protein FRX31_022516 [Thalictrum thalictroides]|uniref:Uncharacterized protein n=1 Tax=Thalictrum thalictroides TaxID=46969 RepID=A0A7J6VUK5_THATH|nr:hypothetical protein FRX31_022516 [Thalictrum thalictroides]
MGLEMEIDGGVQKLKRPMVDDADDEHKKFKRLAGGAYEKAIYFCGDCVDIDNNRRIPGWLVTDLCFSYSKKEDSIMQNMPIKLENLRHYSVVAWNSKIYFVGGEIPRRNFKVVTMENTENVSTEIFAFNVQNQMWDSDGSHPNMLLPRAFSISIAADDKIFVFGSFAPSFFCNNFEKYAEYYDINQGKWNYIPQPPEMLCQSIFTKVRYAVVKNHILFWAYPLGCLYILNIATMEWPTMEEFFGYPRPECHPHNQYPHPHLGPIWSNAVVVFYDALFWHHGGIIYAYDFKENTNSVTELGGYGNNTYFKNFAENNFYPWQSPTTFLLSPEEGRLCLVWRAFYEWPRKYYCQNFQVERQDDKLVLHVGTCSSLDPPPDFANFWNVLVV